MAQPREGQIDQMSTNFFAAVIRRARDKTGPRYSQAIPAVLRALSAYGTRFGPRLAWLRPHRRAVLTQ